MASKLFILVLLTICLAATVNGGCFEDWSRCSKWSSGATGILWYSCNDRCKELGKSGGSCNLVESDGTCFITKGKKISRCHCH